MIVALGGAGLIAVLGVLWMARRRERAVDLVAGLTSGVAGVTSGVAGVTPGASGLTPATPRPVPSLDAATRRRVAKLVASGSRLNAIDLLRQSAGCSLAEAKAVVDELDGVLRAPRASAPAFSPQPAPPSPPNPLSPPAPPAPPGPDTVFTPARRPHKARTRQFPPGFDIDPHRPATRPRRPDEARRLLDDVLKLTGQGRSDEAARLLHERTGMSLAEARTAVGRLS